MRITSRSYTTFCLTFHLEHNPIIMSRYNASYEFEIETDIATIEVVKKYTLKNALDYAQKIMPFTQTTNVVVCVYRNLRLYDTMSVSEFIRRYSAIRESVIYKQSFDL